jgi:hypothetical protein
VNRRGVSAHFFRATTKEQVYIPEGTDAAAVPAPLFAAPAKKKRALPRATAVKTPAPKKSAKKCAKNKTAKKTAIKEPKKAAKSPERKRQNHQRDAGLPQKRRRSVEDG